MNLLEFVCFLVFAAIVILCSRGLGHLAGIPEVVAVIPVLCLLVLLLRVFTKGSLRGVLILISLLASVVFLSIGIAHGWGLRDSIFATPLAATLALIVVQGGRLLRRRINLAPLQKRERE